MSSLVLQAAQSAAAADGVVAPGGEAGVTPTAAGGGGMPAPSTTARPMMPPARAAPSQAKKKGPPLRRGKWTVEEEAYANRLIQEFKAGLLPLTDGTTLRTFLSKLLNCDPMRISKKFVGSNCIGKQVFRRRTADLNRLTPEQIQQSRAELSELERRFLERVAQTNRVKSNAVVGSAASAAAAAAAASTVNADSMPSTSLPYGSAGAAGGMNQNQLGYLGHPAVGNGMGQMMTPPWLQPPQTYKPGMAANSRAAAAGRAMLGVHDFQKQHQQQQQRSSLEALKRQASAGGLQSMGLGGAQSSNSDLLAQLQRQASQSSLFGTPGSSNNLLAAARSGGFSSQALAQLAQNASAARLAGLGSSGNLNAQNPSMNNLLSGVGGLSRDQLGKLAGGSSNGLSSTTSLSNVMGRQNSFDALMSLDFQSIQSIDNLANLIQTGAAPSGNVPQAGMKNADFGNLGGTNAAGSNSAGDLNMAAQRLASSARMGSFLQSLSSSNNIGASASASNLNSSANLSNLMKTMQQQQAQQQQQSGGAGGSVATSASLANLLRPDSSTGLSALRMQEGINARNTSVDDFLSLMAAGDIPHQDPAMLNVPLMDQQQGGTQASQQQRQLQSMALANALSSRSLNGMVGNGGSNAALFNAAANGGADGQSQTNLNAMLAMAMAGNAAAAASAASVPTSGTKRTLDQAGGGGDPPSAKR